MHQSIKLISYTARETVKATHCDKAVTILLWSSCERALELLKINIFQHFTVKGITVLCHFRKNDVMPVIICKTDKHLVTL